MDKFVINGQKPLAGDITVAGDKNTALKIIPACVLLEGKTRLTNMPDIRDVNYLYKLMEAIGGTVSKTQDGRSVEIDTTNINKTTLPDKLVTKTRASSLFAGPMLARFGTVTLHHPGGDVIGERPLDLLLDGLEALGADVQQNDRSYTISSKSLGGGTFVFRHVSVTVTENLIMAAARGKGTSRLINAALEPSIIALADFLNSRGAKIKGAGSPTITIEGVGKLKADERDYKIIPDRIEAGTFACLAAASNGEITIKDCVPEHMEVFLKHLDLMGVEYVRRIDELTIKKRKNGLRAIDIRTHEYPGLATDYQAPLTVLFTQAKGISMVHETIFEGRLFYTDKLKQMGAKIIIADPHRVIINGPSKLIGRKIVSPDIRAGIALVIAGLVAEGETTVGNINQIDRGYQHIDERLRALGADIKRVQTDYF